ncbi:hypothetical protein MKW98_011279 [Papaver atlanticum]|uniref:Uncharacterized protein n=1 Tax=Papaver atlanticum TaxID=357466 RepID=A0AAD4XKR4_9MAGN|nr:hypothetical protein MKW98_011279 [Papaver atlanticum]
MVTFVALDFAQVIEEDGDGIETPAYDIGRVRLANLFDQDGVAEGNQDRTKYKSTDWWRLPGHMENGITDMTTIAHLDIVVIYGTILKRDQWQHSRLNYGRQWMRRIFQSRSHLQSVCVIFKDMAPADNEAVLHGIGEFVDLKDILLTFQEVQLSTDEYRQGKLNPLAKFAINPFVLL